MEKQKKIRNIFLLAALIVSVFLCSNAIAQPVVGLDNWFNNETNAKTNKPFHYLWSDTENSGYSRWGEIFTSKGAQITYNRKTYSVCP